MEYIDSFVEAGSQILTSMAQLECNMREPYFIGDEHKAENVIIMVGVTGELKGHAMLSMDEGIAKDIASKMMMGMPVEALDDMAKSALSELTNMVMGTTATKLEGRGLSIDITPPSLMTGEKLSVSNAAMKTVCIPIETNIGDINFNISIKNK
ncbi:MAG: chemotaxis protein CheX [Peptoclostridium sp.]|uniref:chemotaxis protein CheX n=1 Tax=Peptoclostridium sp. TaxID=1904860 RepID=UPI00139D7F94|nr:chemotaxis protein CheX [Peptoclostridium sp.]MZQ74962.1 chemotaxis protein CheX [Peptoclostridium sp.]